MLRKHLCSLKLGDHRKGDKIPFFSWNCLTLMLKHRDVDLVIKNERHMDRFLKFLVFHMNTVDGNKDSAKGIYKKLVQQFTQAEFSELAKSKVKDLP